MLEFKVGYKTFKIETDIANLIDKAEIYRDNFYDDSNRVKLNSTDEPVSEEEFKDSVQVLINYLKTIETNPQLLESLIVDNMPKKKDGWLAKNRIKILVTCEDTAYMSEEEYGYRCYCLKAKSISADTISLFVLEDIFGW